MRPARDLEIRRPLKQPCRMRPTRLEIPESEQREPKIQPFTCSLHAGVGIFLFIFIFRSIFGDIKPVDIQGR